jgi:multiple sugar transport system substrate-binding protein
MGGEGPLYALSYDASINSTFFYNKSLFDEHGVALPDDTWTWEEHVIQAAKKFKEAGVEFPMIAPYYADGGWTTLVWEWGGETIDPTYSKGMLSEANALAALTYTNDLMHKLEYAPLPTQDEVNPFTTGQFPMYVGGDWNIGTFKAIEDFEWDVTHWPAGPKGRIVELEPDGYSITKGTKQAEETFKLLKFTVYEDEGAMKQAAYGTVPALRHIAESDAYLEIMPPGKTLQLQDIQENSRGNYFGRGWLEWVGKSDEALQQAWLGKKPIDEAAKDADAAITNVLANLGDALF